MVGPTGARARQSSGMLSDLTFSHADELVATFPSACAAERRTLCCITGETVWDISYYTRVRALLHVPCIHIRLIHAYRFEYLATRRTLSLFPHVVWIRPG